MQNENTKFKIGTIENTIENRPFDQLKLGDSAQLIRTLNLQDIQLFAVMSGDVNPAHLDEEFAKTDMFHAIVGHGMWTGALISSVLGTQLPGAGTVYLGQSLRFHHPVALGDTVTVSVTVIELNAEKHRVKLDCQVINQRKELVVSGTADVIAPTEKIVRQRVILPEVDVHQKRLPA